MIGARAGSPIVCSCEVDGWGRVGILAVNRPAQFVAERFAVLFFLAYCILRVSRNSCAAVEFLIETQLENRNAQALFISLIAWW